MALPRVQCSKLQSMRTMQQVASTCFKNHLIQTLCFVRESHKEELMLVGGIQEVQSFKTMYLSGLFPGDEDVREQNIQESTVELVPV